MKPISRRRDLLNNFLDDKARNKAKDAKATKNVKKRRIEIPY
ncbi:MAG: hypothetical protein ACI4BH_03185 [Muribaculaceae bacterium]